VLREDLAHSIAVDVKGPWSMYPELTGGKMTAQSARNCLERVFGLALSHPGRIYFRCTKVPALSSDDLARTRAQVPEELPLTYQEFVPPRSIEDECENLQPEFRSEYSCPSRL
jgi:pyruvate formate lyase activating enzyme